MSTAKARLYNFQNDSAAHIPISSAKIDTELDGVISSLNQKVQIKSTAPSNPVDGQTWIDISVDPPVMKIYDQTNTGWTDAGVFGGFATYTEKTTVVDDDLIVINDSEASAAIKNVKYSTLVTLANNSSLKGKNAAGDETVDVIKVNASDEVELVNGVILPEITAPTTAANQGALYTKNDGTQTELYFREESNGDEVQITKGGVLSGGVVIGSGTAAHGATIAYPSLPGGKSSGDYTWHILLGVRSLDTSASVGAINKINLSESSRVVTCTCNRHNWVNGSTNVTVNGTANYVIMGKAN